MNTDTIPLRSYEKHSSEFTHPIRCADTYDVQAITELLQAYSEHASLQLRQSPTFNRSVLRLMEFITRPVKTTTGEPVFTIAMTGELLPRRRVTSRTLIARFLVAHFNSTAAIWSHVVIDH